MLKVTCDRCGKELDEAGGLVFGPPEGSFTKKWHICNTCWADFSKGLLPISNLDKSFVGDIHGCQRCGENHLRIKYQRFTHPVCINKETPRTHFAICPTNQEPILIHRY